MIPDDEKILSCSVGGEDKMDSIKLFITYFEVLGGEIKSYMNPKDLRVEYFYRLRRRPNPGGRSASILGRSI